jgi:glycine cleavage system aminomethyltransferase T/glycine/D-amino acid oxidase-like deaminating enzyme
VERANVVIVGGGIMGCSVAYHLAQAGWKDVLLVEKGELTSGSTHHAAGLVTEFNPSATMMSFRRQSVELYRRLGVFETVGSVRIASSRDSLLDLRRAVSRAHGIGLTAHLISPSEVLELLPWASPESLYGGVWMEGDGYVDPHIATHAVADAARELGVRLALRRRVTGIELGPHREVRLVRTDAGAIEAGCVVNASGIWATQLAAMVGAFIASVPVDHQHVAMQAVAGHELPRDAPCFRDTDNLVYGKTEAGGMLVGGYEPDPVARWTDGVPWDHGGRPVESDMDRFAQLLQGAIRRFPLLEDAGVMRLLCHPDAMTPDGNPLLGPMPGVRGLWVAAGLSLNGFGGAGGMGRALAEWMTDGRPQLDLSPYRPWRFGRLYRDSVVAAEAAREAYRYYYRLRYPLDVSEAARGRRLSPLHARLEELGAVFGAKNGWERAEHFEPGSGWRRAGADQRGFGWSRPPWFERVASEHAAFRERVGIVDVTSFGKIELSGPGALELLERVCDNRVDREVGRVVYSQFLDSRGGILGDLTVTRLGEERFRVVSGAAAVDTDLGWLRMNMRDDGPPVELRDVTDELAVIGIWGPRSRELLAGVTDADLSTEAFPFSSARPIHIGGADLLAQRITYVGELGYELYVAPEWAVQVWDRLWRTGAEHGISAGGYRALDSLRIEKGYRYLGSDLTAADTPYEAGLGFCVAMDKGDFNGRAALDSPAARAPVRRLRTLVVGEDERHLQLYGGEAVRLDGEVIGRVRSCAYGFTVRRNVALATVPADLATGDRVEVDVLGDGAPAELAPDALVDPEDERVRV